MSSVCLSLLPSLSARRAWIEIGINPDQSGKTDVALRKESVDRNVSDLLVVSALPVALRKESVDRNMPSLLCRLVAGSSLSARRAWIEMHPLVLILRKIGVALRKESVDRNTSCTSIGRPKRLSLSARRAWIEI